MRVALLVDNMGPGGVQRRILELIKGLVEYEDVELSLIVFSEKIFFEEVHDMGIPITILKRKPKKNPLVFYRLFRKLKKWQPDVIHSWGTMSAILAIPSAKLLGIPLLNSCITNAPQDPSFFDKRRFRASLTYPFSRVVISNSMAGLKAYRVPAKKAVCVYNGFDERRTFKVADTNSIREAWGIHSNFTVGMVGILTDKKDFESFIEAGVHVLEQRTDVNFLIIGDGPNGPALRNKVPDAFKNYFIFTGMVRDVESLVNVLDIGVLLTNNEVHGEGISNAILEYMAFAKPVVASSGGGTDEAITDNESGFLIPPRSPEILSEKLFFLLENQEKRSEMGAAAKALLDARFNLKEMTQTYYKLYLDNQKG